MNKVKLFECWDNEENLGLIIVNDLPQGFDIDRAWKNWYENTIRNDEPLDVEEFAYTLTLDGVNAERAYVEQIEA
jgi:hypothetical protein